MTIKISMKLTAAQYETLKQIGAGQDERSAFNSKTLIALHEMDLIALHVDRTGDATRVFATKKGDAFLLLTFIQDQQS